MEIDFKTFIFVSGPFTCLLNYISYCPFKFMSKHLFDYLKVYTSNKNGSLRSHPDSGSCSYTLIDDHGPLRFKELQAMDDIELANVVIFGNRSFRPLQYQACKAAMENRDCFVLLPTGGGKSLCYQVTSFTLFDDGVLF